MEENKRKSENEWITPSGICKMTIEISGDVTTTDVYEQWKGLMEGAGYCMDSYGG